MVRKLVLVAAVAGCSLYAFDNVKLAAIEAELPQQAAETVRATKNLFPVSESKMIVISI